MAQCDESGIGIEGRFSSLPGKGVQLEPKAFMMDAAASAKAAAPAPADPAASATAAVLAALDTAPRSDRERERIARLANDPSTMKQLVSLRQNDPQVDSLFKAFMQL